MSKERFFEATAENVAKAVALAESASLVTSYCADDITPEDLGIARANGEGPIWYCWAGTKQDPLFVAITGNGPTSERNAAFFSCARDVVITLGEELQRLRERPREPSCEEVARATVAATVADLRSTVDIMRTNADDMRRMNLGGEIEVYDQADALEAAAEHLEGGVADRIVAEVVASAPADTSSNPTEKA